VREGAAPASAAELQSKEGGDDNSSVEKILPDQDRACGAVPKVATRLRGIWTPEKRIDLRTKETARALERREDTKSSVTNHALSTKTHPKRATLAAPNRKTSGALTQKTSPFIMRAWKSPIISRRRSF
jgi:hypothetical protein